jgi:hypothetical protein
MGRKDDALELFERLLTLRNDLGLMSEEYDTRAQRLVGNFPQAFSHVSLVNTAFNLSGYPPLGTMDHEGRSKTADLIRQSSGKRTLHLGARAHRRNHKHPGGAST